MLYMVIQASKKSLNPRLQLQQEGQLVMLNIGIITIIPLFVYCR